MVERLAVNQVVAGSSPARGDLQHMTEKLDYRVGVGKEKPREEENSLLKTRGEWVSFLIQNGSYPYYSKKGKIFFRGIKKDDAGIFNKIINNGGIEVLGLKTEEDCRLLREEIKRESAKIKVTRPITEWPEDERPREMLIKHGAEKLSKAKLLSIILRTGDKSDGISAEDLAMQLMSRFGSFRALDSATIHELCSIRGIGPAKAAQVKSALEIGKRFMGEEIKSRRRIKSVEDVVNFYKPYLRDLKREEFKIMLLDGRNKFIKDITLSKGSLASSVVSPGEVIREIVSESAGGVIFVHNHPSGESDPTEDDIKVTNHLIRTCELVGVRVLDHIIIGGDEYTSFVDMGLIGGDRV